MRTIKFQLNGEAREVEAWPDEPLLEVLRETFKLKSLKSGCAPQRECGACLALIDGQPKVTCAVRVEQVEGRSITTLEGVSDAERRLYADAFQVAAGLQCGFCTPGLVLRIKWMTDQGAKADARRDRPADRRASVPLHRLREDHRRGRADPAGQARRRAAGGGRGRRRRPAAASATRAANWRSASGRSSPTSTRPDCSTASSCCRRMRARGSSASTSPRRWRCRASSRSPPPRTCPATAGSARSIADWPCFVAEGEEARCVGDVLAAVAAETPAHRSRGGETGRSRIRAAAAGARPRRSDQARRAAGQSQARQPAVDDALCARRRRRRPRRVGACGHRRLDDAAHRASVPRARGLPRRAAARRPPAHLQPGPGHLRGSPADRRPCSAKPEERLYVELAPNGGGFGGKEDMTIQAQTALLARMTGRPVRIALSREESIRIHPKRHPLTMTYTVGCDAEGRLTAVEGRYSRRFRRLRLGRRQGAGARRRPRLRALPDAGARDRGGRRLHQQSAVRRDARLRRQPDQLRHRGLSRPARRQGRASTAGRCAGATSCGSAT